MQRKTPTSGLTASTGPMGSCKRTGRLILYSIEPLFGTVIRGTFKLRLVGRCGWTSRLILFNGALFHVVSTATLHLEAEGHSDTERGLTKVKDALFPTSSLSSFFSHFLSSIICSFCWRSVSCICCFSLCHRRWASSLLLGSTRGNSLSYKYSGGGSVVKMHLKQSLFSSLHTYTQKFTVWHKHMAKALERKVLRVSYPHAAASGGTDG